VATSLSFNNVTKIWTFSYNGVGLSDIESGRFQVTKHTPTTVTTICNSTLAASSGGLTCNLTAYVNDKNTFIGEGFIKFTGNYTTYGVERGSLSFDLGHLKYGLSGFYLGFVVVGTLAMVGLFSPVISMVMALFGLVITNMMGLVYLNPTWLIGIGIVGVVYIYSVRQP
jgi:hypothetical protein